MTDQRYSYRTDRILLSAARLLDTQFDGFSLHLTGAQVEMLRNVVDYLNRPSSYVETYGDGYYITPDAADFDEIQAIVADLEDKLMGNDNVPWGYNDRLVQATSVIDTEPATVDLTLGDPPAGELWIITSMTWHNETSVNTRQVITLEMDSVGHYVARIDAPVANIPNIVRGLWYLKEDDYIRFRFVGCYLGDNIYANIHGYKMQVPE